MRRGSRSPVRGRRLRTGKQLPRSGCSATLLGSNWRFILRPHVAALDFHPPGIIDADEDAGAGDVGRVIDRRTLVAGRDLLFEFGHPLVDLLGQLVGAFVFVGETAIFGKRCVIARLLFLADRRIVCRQSPQPIAVAVREVDCDFGPFPTLGADFLHRGVEFFAGEAIEQRHVLQPAAVVVHEKIAQNDATCRFIGFDADEDRAFVARLHCTFGQHASDCIRLGVVGAAQSFPDRLLPCMIVGDAESRQLLERHFLGDVKIEQLLARRREFQALAHHLCANEKSRGDVVDAQSLLVQVLEGPKLIKRVQRLAHRVLGERVLLFDTLGLDDAGNRRILGEALLLHEKFQCSEAATAGTHRKLAGFLLLCVQHWPHAQRLQQSAPGDVLREILNAHPRLDPPHIGVRRNQPI